MERNQEHAAGAPENALVEKRQETADRPFLIAIDGPAGSGKSTLARALAGAFGLGHIDTGAMYRALALKALREEVDPGDPAALQRLLETTDIGLDREKVLLDGRDVARQIRSRDVSAAASRIARDTNVRAWCVERQRLMAKRHSEGAVVEGRDIGTVVLPDAALKIFLTADLEERASRRALQSGAHDAETLEKVRDRDRRDSERKASPLTVAEDAIVVDTTAHSADEILAMVTSMVTRTLQEARDRRAGRT